MRRNKCLSVDEMKLYEQEINSILDRYDLRGLSDEELLKRLNLNLEYVMDNQLGKAKKAGLYPPEDESSNGTIKIKISSENKDQRFSYMHEIVHYLCDVGFGNKVKEIYTRGEKGSQKDFSEQKIDYQAAAISLPRSEFADLLRAYDAKIIGKNELQIIEDLETKYKQPRKAIERRIKEVRKMDFPNRKRKLGILIRDTEIYKLFANK